MGRRDTIAADSRGEPAPQASVPAADDQRASFRATVNKAEVRLLLENYEDSRQGWFWSTDHDGRLTYLTDSVVTLLANHATRLAGAPFTELFQTSNEETKASRTLAFQLAKRLSFEKLALRAAVASDERWWAVSGNPQFDPSGQFTGYRGSAVDITEQRQTTKHASQLAMYDALTGLPNRRSMAVALEAHLVALKVQKRSCAVMLIDLDRFKQVNDTLGHPAGDALLKQVAERLLKIVGDRDRVFRLGGDEFQIIVCDCQDRGALGDLGTHVISSLSQPYSVDGHRCIIGASIGVAMSPFDGVASDELIRNADLALYAAKDAGRGRFRFFSNELLRAAEDKRILEGDLRDALARGELDLFYQPIVDAKTECTTGVEALVRWNHPERGPISPALFVPIAEEANLIEQLGEWVLRKACEDAAKWPGKIRVAVNVSPLQFISSSLPKVVMSALASSGLAPDRLEIEITEGVFLSEGAATDTMFATLKQIGVRLALDDFGTGYSSLSYLRTAPFDKIKIDQSFVRAATLPKSRNRAIIAAIVALAEALGMETTAEGIESHDQLDLVRSLRVSHVQGWIYSKAVPSEVIGERLENGEWLMVPSGPAKQRFERQSMYRTVGAIDGHVYHSVLIRNLSESGALIEGSLDIPVGGLVLLDLREGQLVFGRVRRVAKGRLGIEFEQPLVSDGDGGLCTSNRVSAAVLSKLNLPSAEAPDAEPVAGADNTASLETIRAKLGMTQAPVRAHLMASGAEGALSIQRELGEFAPETGALRSLPTINQLSQQYLETVRGDAKRHETDLRCLKDYILPRFGTKRADELAPSEIGEWLARMISQEDWSPAKANRLRGVLGQMFVMAMQWGTHGGDAAQGVSLVNRSARERSLTTEELERLNTATEASLNPQLKSIVTLLMLTGTRQRDLLEAEWAHVDLDRSIWRIPSAQSGKERTVALSRAAIAIFRELPRAATCPQVIVNPKTGRPYRSFFNSWDTARRRAGLADLEIDDLRHSASGDVLA